jgi:N-acetylglucosaminyldiphosphoundecaprenol N-acetyl-beta-D-mannosaminyltransferase
MTMSDLLDTPSSMAARPADDPLDPLDHAVGSTDVDGELHRRWSHRRRVVGSVPFVARHPRPAAQDLVDAAAAGGRTRGEHVHLANAYSVALGRTDPGVAAVLDIERGWNLPDGKPVMWVSALRGDEGRLRQVRGPQFMLDVIDLGRAAGLRHYLLGGAPETLELLERNLAEMYPGVQLVGTDSPPFRTPTTAELVDRDSRIARSEAHVVWVGLGTPKQDLEALRLASSLPVVAVAVGAAFDFAAGTVKPAPHWVGAIGFEWLWRLLSEPRRLWRRYTFGNAHFIAAVIAGERRARREALAHPEH